MSLAQQQSVIPIVLEAPRERRIWTIENLMDLHGSWANGTLPSGLTFGTLFNPSLEGPAEWPFGL